MKRIVLLFLLLSPVALHAASCATETGASFSYYKAVTIQTGQVPSSQSGFPALVPFLSADGNFATVGNGGHVQSSSGFDICPFSNSSLTTPLTYELVSYSATTGAFEMWVNMTAVDGGVVYLGHGDSSITVNATSSSTWDANFKGVYHVPDGTTLTTNDSTSNANNGTNHNWTAASAKIDGGAFSGTTLNGTFIDVSGLPSTTTGDFTVSIWANSAAFGTDENYQTVFSDGAVGGGAYTNYFSAGNGHANFYNNGIGTWLNGSVSLSTSTWYLLTFVRTGNTRKIYVNGALDTSSSAGDSGSGQTGRYIGERVDTTVTAHPVFDGTLDEFHLSNSARSADWITTEYNNQSAPASFWSTGSETSTGGGGPTCPKGMLPLLGVSCGAFIAPGLLAVPDIQKGQLAFNACMNPTDGTQSPGGMMCEMQRSVAITDDMASRFESAFGRLYAFYQQSLGWFEGSGVSIPDLLTANKLYWAVRPEPGAVPPPGALAHQ